MDNYIKDAKAYQNEKLIETLLTPVDEDEENLPLPEEMTEDQRKLTELFMACGGNTRKFKRALEKQSGQKKWNFGGYKR